MQDDIFTSRSGTPDDILTAQLSALVAPLAKNSNAVIDDPGLLDVARAVFAAYASTPTIDGLTMRELRAACAHVCDDDAVFEQRFHTFQALRMLLPAFEKKYEQRYILHPISMVGMHVILRVCERGGIGELIALLDHTRSAIEHHGANEDDVRESLLESRRILTVIANHLHVLVDTRTLDELIAERRQHEHPGLMEHVQALSNVVTDRFPALDTMAVTVTITAHRYVSARERFLNRIIEDGARSGDFSVLSPEEYLTAFKHAPVDLLSEVFTHVPVDPPDPGINAAALAEEVQSLSVRRVRPTRPPRPENRADEDDPLQDVLRKKDRRRQQAHQSAELVQREPGSTELTDRMRSWGWPLAAVRLTELLHISDPKGPYEIEMTDTLFVSPGEPLTYLSRVLLHRHADSVPVQDGMSPAEALVEEGIPE
ncbi:hypothetical protein HNR06_005334 [Nocardiopsis arvandica]|uniref:Uncharacterized protein n=1 Tax=Nocardiopsis sinuspersici TaxID=501010 RepID=A0A7Y9XJQ8_9ACTN|nr:hypothetical protein [Nocardiopsis sinuspersici]NYH55745.1 hypothetical protein [Nocardiopsis sinuspersici]